MTVASIGPVAGIGQLVIAYGHYRSGVLLSALSGALVRDHVLGKLRRERSERAGPSDFASAFHPARFA